MRRRRGREGVLLGAAFLITVLLRASLLPTPDHEDLWIFKKWALQGALRGLHAIYLGNQDAWPTEQGTWYGGYLCDYPPVIPLALRSAGALYLALIPEARSTTQLDSRSEELFTSLIKLPGVLLDLAIALLLFAVYRRRGSFQAAYGVFLLYAFNPAAILDVAYWGGPDSFHSLFALVALLAVASPRAGGVLAGAAAMLAALSKPQGTVYLPLVLILLVRRRGLAGLGRAFEGAALAAATVLSPFLVHGTLTDFLWTQLHTVGMQPTLSNNAHNLWWLASLGRGIHYLDSGNWFLGITYRTAGLGLFAATYGAILLAAARNPAPERLANLFALTAATVYMLPTEIHENHLFAALPLLLAPPFPTRQRLGLYLGFTITQALNLLTHDEYLSGLLPSGNALRFLGVCNSTANLILFLFLLLRTLSSKGASDKTEPATPGCVPAPGAKGRRLLPVLAAGTQVAALGLACTFARWVVLKAPCSAPCTTSAAYAEWKGAGWPRGPVWTLNRNGAISQRFDIPKRALYRVRAQVRPRSAGGEAPEVELKADGRTLFRGHVTRPGFSDLSAMTLLEPGRHLIELAFLNDFYAPPLDRDVDIAEISVDQGQTNEPRTRAP